MDLKQLGHFIDIQIDLGAFVFDTLFTIEKCKGV